MNTFKFDADLALEQYNKRKKSSLISRSITALCLLALQCITTAASAAAPLKLYLSLICAHLQPSVSPATHYTFTVLSNGRP